MEHFSNVLILCIFEFDAHHSVPNAKYLVHSSFNRGLISGHLEFLPKSKLGVAIEQDMVSRQIK